MNKKISTEWMKTPEIITIIDALGENNIRFVGGCVRNALMGLTTADVDLATKHTPDTVQKILQKSGIKTIPTGIDHGTITAVMKGQSYEITTLRRDIHTDGRHAKVEFSQCWIDDAKRRDFTMNTLLADKQGNIYDPTGQGLDDLEAGHVVFVGNAESRITEDVLRILRFFRFHAYYGKGEPDAVALQACKKHASLITSLSRERITQEFIKIMTADNALDTMSLMFEYNVLSDFDRPQYRADFETLCQAGDMDVAARFFALIRDQELAARHLILTNAYKKHWKRLVIVNELDLAEEQSVKEAVYRHSRDAVRQIAHIKKIDQVLITLIQKWDIPVFPIKAQSLMDQGHTPGPDLGAELKRQENEWIKNEFKL